MLLVDIGNTYIKFKYGELKEKIKTSEFNSSLDLGKLSFDLSKVNSVVISSVSIGKEKIIIDYLSEYSIPYFLITKDIKTRVEYPKVNNELGADLIALMEGCSLKGDTFISISLGTAIAICFVRNNKFMGCAISPGILSSLSGLVDSASLIEKIDLYSDSKYNLLGMNTTESLKTGLLNGYTFLIDGFIKEIKEKYNLKEVDTYMMGGFSEVVKKTIKSKVIIDEDLIFKGMVSLYKENKEL